MKKISWAILLRNLFNTKRLLFSILQYAPCKIIETKTFGNEHKNKNKNNTDKTETIF